MPKIKILEPLHQEQSSLDEADIVESGIAFSSLSKNKSLALRKIIIKF
jgi:hypothetical protein